MSYLPRFSMLAGLMLAGVLSGAAVAAEKPLWELGLGVSALSLPDYRGSNHDGYYALPFPYVVYRGEFLKADRNGIRGTFFDNDRIELNVSVGASLPVSSDKNPARQGMPDLRPSVEIGPSLDINLWRTPDRATRLDVRLPVRSVITVSGSMQDIGWVFSPRVNLDMANVAGLPGWNLGVLAGPMYGSRRYHQYYYSVPSQYATATRPAFEAQGGYEGTQFLVALSKRYPKFWLGAFARWDTLKGATFEASPLVTRNHYMAAGVGISWILGESSTRVQADE